MSTFAWMFVEQLHIYRMLTEVRNINFGHMRFYYVVGWGIPAIITGTLNHSTEALFAFPSISTGKWPHWRWVWMHSATTVTWVFSCTRRSRCIASSRSRWNLADLCPKCLLSQLKWFWGRYSNKNIVAPRWKQDSLTLLGYKHVFIWTTVFVVILNSPVLVVKSMSVSMLRYGHSLWRSGCSGFRSNAAHGALLSFPECSHCSAFNQQ